MNRLQLSLPVVFALALGLSVVGNAAAERPTEPKGLVTFDMPDGWSDERFRNGRHFTRAGSADDPNVLGIVPEHRDQYMTLEKMSEGRKQVNKMQVIARCPTGR